jgi:nucleoside-diphosphate-sugar epimerase
MANDERTHEPHQQARVLVVGCGALGSQIALQLTDTAQVFGLKRHPETLPAPIQPIAADLQKPEQLAEAIPGQLDAVIYCLTPNQYDDDGYRAAFVTGLSHLLSALGEQERLQQLLFVSSSGVYHQDDDGWVDENSPTLPERFNGQRLLEGEKLVLESRWPATVLRFSGIYGPSRSGFLQSVIRGRLAPGSPGPFTNRIHQDDAARAAAHLIRRSLAGKSLATCYLASDQEPTRLDEVVAWVQARTACAEPASDARAGGRAGSKRCDSARLRETGFAFRYPDFRAGYAEMIRKVEFSPFAKGD